jgi:3-oxoacyl-[acyl-carrier-protein] synthase-3
MFVSRRGASDRILNCISDTHVVAFDGERSDADAITAFRAANPARIRAAIVRCLSEAGLKIDDVKYVVPHTPYGSIWDLVADLLRIDRTRILTDYLSETGHLSSNDVFAHYDRAVRDGRITTGDLALLVSPGFGGTRGCTLIRH